MTIWGFFGTLLWVALIAAVVALFYKDIRALLGRVRRWRGLEFDPLGPHALTPRRRPGAPEEMTPAEMRLGHRVDRTVTAHWNNCADIYWVGYNLIATSLHILNDGGRELALSMLGAVQTHLDSLHFTDGSYAQSVSILRERIGASRGVPISQPARKKYWLELIRLRDELGAHFEAYQGRPDA